MIVGVVCKGAGILVIPALGVPFVFAVIVENMVFPDSKPGSHLWVLGMALLVSSMVLWKLNRYFKQGPRPTVQKPASDGYAKFSRHPSKEPNHFQTRLRHRFRNDHDTGWFMFIPTGFWPYPIAILGLFLVVGNIIAAVTSA